MSITKIKIYVICLVSCFHSLTAIHYVPTDRVSPKALAVAQALAQVGVIAQETYTVSGYLKDDSTGEALVGANIYVKESLKGTSTNIDGFYSLMLDKGNYTLIVKFVGYEDAIREINLTKNITLNIRAKSRTITTGEVIITGKDARENINSAEMGTEVIPVEEMKALPALLGEVDVLQTIQLLPGVQSAKDGNTGFYVRGGGPDQNLILLDDAVVYNASHLLGFYSIFNSDAVREVKLIKGGMPADYGGRLSSVLDITSQDGDYKKHHSSGSIGLLSSKLTIQGPLKKDTSSFIVSGRRSYVEVVSKPFFDENANNKGSGYYFYDVNGKLNYKVSEKDNISLSGYMGRDVFNLFNKTSGFGAKILWGNAIGSLRWQHIFNDKISIRNALFFSNYKNEITITQDEFLVKLFSGITDMNVKTDMNWFPNIFHNFKFGAGYIFHTLVPTNIATVEGEQTLIDVKKKIKLYSHEAALYLADTYDVSERIKISGGLRYSFFQHIGPFTRYVKNEIGQITDTIHYNTGANIKTYHHIEPRISLRYKLGLNSSVKVSYAQNYQYIHLASFTTISLPSDIWVPSTSIVKPQISKQSAIGYFMNFNEDKYETSAELYYKIMENQIEYKDGYAPNDDILDNPDNNFVFGKGWAYGSEFFIKRKAGKTTGWIGYTLSWTIRQYPDINLGEKFFAKYDRRHDMSVIAVHKINAKWSLSAVFVYATGNAITLPVARYVIRGEILNEYGKRNSYRMEPYHRVDVSATYIHKKTDKFESSWNLSIYNVYNRYNPYFIYFENTGNLEEGTLEVKAKQVSVFPILPSVTWSFKF